jgi:antitoxin component of RelBE/YafQ-DinJ toxin-antitoxin module
MAKTKILDQSVDSEVAEVTIEFLDDLGFSPEEAIPGLINTIIMLAEKTAYPEMVLDEAANLLADSGVW